MPHGDMRVYMNKARLAEAGRGSYPNGIDILERNITWRSLCYAQKGR